MRPPSPVPAGDAGRLQSYLDTLVSGARTPGLQYVVVDATGIVREYDGGWADLRDRVPMAPATTMMAYSMSKTVTAAAVLQLAEAGKLALADTVDRYVDAVPGGDRITVRQLLAHTSGLPNPIPLRWVHPAGRHAAFDEDAALAAVLREHPRLAFAPGTKYAYSNLGYWLLGKIVERVSGEPFVSQVSRQVLRPLGALPEELGYLIANPSRHATGYLEKYSLMNLAKGLLLDRELLGGYDGRWLRIDAHYPNGPAFGGLVGTARGFGKFLQDQLRPHSVLFGDATRALFYEPQTTADGRPVPMTLGWHVDDRNGVRRFFKEGGGGGFHCMMRVYPDSRTAAVMMANATGFDVRRALDACEKELIE